MMKISLLSGKGYVDCVPTEVRTLDEFGKLATEGAYSCSIFNENYRNKKNFIEAESIGLDIDENISIARAKELFANHRHLIMPTKNHQKMKNGKICDRFRVILFLSRPIKSETEYYATWYTLKTQFPFIDPACKDPSRYWDPSTSVLSFNEHGRLIEPSQSKPKPKLEVVSLIEDKGQLSLASLEFLHQGAPAGKRNGILFKVAKDMQQNQYSFDECCMLIDRMIATTGNWGTSRLNDTDRKTIRSAYSQDNKHIPRQNLRQTSSFDFRPVGEILDSKDTLEWVVQGMLVKGGLSLIAGVAKSGKSTLAKQLSKEISRGGSFLGRKVRKGKVLYLAMEEQKEMMKEEITKMGVANHDNILFHVGPVSTMDAFSELKEIIISEEPELVVIDTIALLSQNTNLNNYKDTYDFLSKYRNLARDTGCHIMMVHHQNKSIDGGMTAIMGSSAFTAATDCNILIEGTGEFRTINSLQRGGEPFTNGKIHYTSETNTYHLRGTF